jgi:mannose/fructose/N-acetylgalactosamine-specific phosphotransferase system component IIC
VDVKGLWKGLVGFIVARPLIAVAIAAVVVAVLYFGFSHRQTTPVTHRT